MKCNIARPIVAGIGVFLTLTGSASAAVESSTVTTFTVSNKPIATTVTADGRWFFALTGKKSVAIYGTDGVLKDTIQIADPADTIAASPTGDRLFLSDKASGKVSVVALNFIQTIDTTGAPFKGPENAPVEIVLFSDFQCPYCARVGPLMDQILAMYPKDVKLVYKNFPLQSHQFSLTAAIAAFAANRQGKFWEMHDKIFENYSNLNEGIFSEFAKALGLDMDKFSADMKDPQLRQQVQLDLQSGIKADVRGTPTIFINGRRLNERSLDGMRALINAELSKRKAK